MNSMRLGLLAMSLGLVMSAPVQAFDLKKFTDSANQAVNNASQKANSSISQVSEAAGSGMAVSGDAQALVNSLTEDLGVTQQQAVGGAGAMLAMAQNSLSADQFGGILDQVSGLDSLLGGGSGVASSLLGNISSLQGVAKVFASLGLNADMIAQFAPTILGFLGNEGVGASALNSLKGLWGVAG